MENLENAPEPRRRGYWERIRRVVGEMMPWAAYAELPVLPENQPNLAAYMAAPIEQLQITEPPAWEIKTMLDSVGRYSDARGAANFASATGFGWNIIREQLPRLTPQECLQVYQREIHGDGLVADFGYSPRCSSLLRGITLRRHMVDPVALWGSIVLFRQYTDTMSGYVDKEIISPSSQSSQVTPGVTPELIATYELFGDAVTLYAQILEDVTLGIATTREAEDAARAVCRVVSPILWDGRGPASPVHDSSAGLYLRVLLPEGSTI